MYFGLFEVVILISCQLLRPVRLWTDQRARWTRKTLKANQIEAIGILYICLGFCTAVVTLIVFIS